MNKADLPGIISSPRKPNIMQFLFTLKDEIDCSVMYDAMQKTIKRYPYFAFRIIRTENGIDCEVSGPFLHEWPKCCLP